MNHWQRQRRPNTTQRGYGWAHQKRRLQAKVMVESGRAICWRCQRVIQPGTPWDLGHDDHDRRIIRGPEHAACNRATRTHEAANRRQRAANPPPALAFFHTDGS